MLLECGDLCSSVVGTFKIMLSPGMCVHLKSSDIGTDINIAITLDVCQIAPGMWGL